MKKKLPTPPTHGRFDLRLCVAGLFLVTGCATVPAGPPAAAPVMYVSAVLPRIQAATQTMGTQRHGKVTITLAPTQFDTVNTQSCAYGFADKGFLVITPPGVSLTTHEKFNELTYNSLSVSPQALTFLLTIHNGMNRVFRGAGAVVQFNVDNHLEAVEQSNYLDFINALLPPGGEAQIRIAGPALRSLRDSTTLAVSLYDVVTDIDNAGNVVKRDNYEWFYRVRQEHVAHSVPASRRVVWIPRNALGGVAEIRPDGSKNLLPNKRCLTNVVPDER